MAQRKRADERGGSCDCPFVGRSRHGKGQADGPRIASGRQRFVLRYLSAAIYPDNPASNADQFLLLVGLLGADLLDAAAARQERTQRAAGPVVHGNLRALHVPGLYRGELPDRQVRPQESHDRIRVYCGSDRVRLCQLGDALSDVRVELHIIVLQFGRVGRVEHLAR